MADVITLPRFREMKSSGEKIVMHTAYNAWQTVLVEESGADVVLVGDSVGMVEHGYSGTVPVTMDMMLLHTASVVRARKRVFVVADMPFLSYEIDEREAVINAGRFIKEAGADAVKLEGGVTRESVIRAIVSAGIPVVGHVGLTPQTAASFGGFKVQGRDADRAWQIVADAEAVERAGAFLIVLECVPSQLAAYITNKLAIPTIGIGAGRECDGQVLVLHDILGLFRGFRPKFVRRYVDGVEVLGGALAQYTNEVRQGAFPSEEHTFNMDTEAAKDFIS
ncbi:MAG: 3-methyl-2-oxobutanoate hydroxymethyltransferase [Aminobacteriaceae bacterium]